MWKYFTFGQFNSVIVNLTNNFHLAMHLFSYRSQMMLKWSQMMLKYVNNWKMTCKSHLSVSLMLLPHFEVFCDLLLYTPMVTWDLFVLCSRKRKNTVNVMSSTRKCLSSKRSSLNSNQNCLYDFAYRINSTLCYNWIIFHDLLWNTCILCGVYFTLSQVIY